MKKYFQTLRQCCLSFLGLIVGLLMAALILEVVVRFSRLDLRLLRYNLFYSPYDNEVYQKSDDPHLMYSPKPNRQFRFSSGMHPLDKTPYPRIVTINQFGFRSPEWPEKKAPGIFRISFLVDQQLMEFMLPIRILILQRFRLY